MARGSPNKIRALWVEKIKALRPKIDEKYKSVQEFAKTLGYSRETYYEWIKGHMPQDVVSCAGKIIAALDLEPDYFREIIGDLPHESHNLIDWHDVEQGLPIVEEWVRKVKAMIERNRRPQ
jgi:DNA-binding XRE family transcriptional regulator